ncbi:hypothetical protein H0H92_002192, partial [Tricholoma furcatifolium]
MSNGSSVVSTLIGGIQDISALLPLLGTEQCEEFVSSALYSGYLYAAASPMSLFGSLGVARAGAKALIAAISIPSWRFFGAEKLKNAEFTAFGNLSLIMMDNDYPQLYLAETSLDFLLDEMKLKNMLTVQDLQRLRLRMPTFQWNVKILGTFVTTIFLQIVIERRLLTILRKRLIFHALKNGNNMASINVPEWEDKISSERTLSYLDDFIHRRSAKDDTENKSPKEDNHIIAIQMEYNHAFLHLSFGAFSIWDVASYIILFLGIVSSIVG